MATSEDLVPNDLPQGGRQEVVAGMREAGIPLASRPQELAASAPPPGGPPPTSAPQPQVGGFDALASRTPQVPFGAGQAGPPPDPLLQLRESPNAIIREIADLMPSYLQGG